MAEPQAFLDAPVVLVDLGAPTIPSRSRLQRRGTEPPLRSRERPEIV